MTVSETPAPKSPLGSRLTRFLRRHARGLLAALAVAGAAVALWVALREHEGVLIYRASAGESPRIRSEMTEGLHGRLFALRALARRSEIRPADEAAWKTTADSVLRLPLEFQGIQWLDPSLTVRRSMPAG